MNSKKTNRLKTHQPDEQHSLYEYDEKTILALMARTSKWERLLAKTKADIYDLARSHPEEAVEYATDLFRTASTALLKLVQSRKTRRSNHFDSAECVLSVQIKRLVQVLCRLLRSGRDAPLYAAFTACEELTQALNDAPAGYELQCIVANRTAMPVLWVNRKRPISDALQRAKDIGLSQGLPVNFSPQSRIDLDAAPTQITARIICRAHKQSHTVKEAIGRIKCFTLQKPKASIRKLSPEDLATLKAELKGCFHGEDTDSLLHFGSLPDFRFANRRELWRRCVKPTLEQSRALAEFKTAYPKFFAALEKAAQSRAKGTSKDYAVLDQLKKRCHQAMNAKSFWRHQ
jgi:hypothetical protein